MILKFVCWFPVVPVIVCIESKYKFVNTFQTSYAFICPFSN